MRQIADLGAVGEGEVGDLRAAAREGVGGAPGDARATREPKLLEARAAARNGDDARVHDVPAAEHVQRLQLCAVAREREEGAVAKLADAQAPGNVEARQAAAALSDDGEAVVGDGAA
eukprot:CAMPEP_0184121022 /NCGR_PEP_ID=MMETSP0974-20121125/22761_1 /TAXON_ID=483370 /ORGANISM="non described non described, Strain CCMP2097" /LENGTH=116 /DNA_ID=CAMNT_0026424223 /DNA_START=45 /DNA_END=392 /DNA_ORIENTATION=-